MKVFLWLNYNRVPSEDPLLQSSLQEKVVKQTLRCFISLANRAGNYMFKVVNFEHISHHVLVFLFLTLSR